MACRGEGIVYLVQFTWFPHCYKIGCTINLEKRTRELEYRFGPLSTIAYGEAFDKLQVECEIQYILSQYSSGRIFAEALVCGMTNDEIIALCPIGSPGSSEHFMFSEDIANLAIELMVEMCNAVVICKKKTAGDTNCIVDWGVLV